MKHLPSKLLILLVFGPSWAVAQGLVEYCPAAPIADANSDPFSIPGALLFRISSEASVVRPGDVIQVLTSVFPEENSQCQITTEVTVSDNAGNLLFSGESEIGDNVGVLLRGIEKTFTASDIPVGLGSPIFIDVHGTATGCTTEELRSFTPVFQKLEPPLTADTVATSAPDLGDYLIKRREAKTPVFAMQKLITAYVKPFKLDCPGGAKPLPFYTDEGSDPSNVIWDIRDGGTSQAPAAETELVILVTPPPILNETCRRSPEYVVDFLPKVAIDITVSDGQGNITTLSGELDANNPAQSFPFPQGINGGRKQYAFQVEARSPRCLAAKGGEVKALLRTTNGGSTEIEQPLDVIVRKDLPPEPIRE